jgi:uncharacterized membrane protein YidH (DUF202 family)
MLDERTRRTDEVSDLLDTVKAYAKQETVEPLKGGLKAVALGLAGVLCLGVGIVVILVGVLRLLQTETTAFRGDFMSVLPYLIVFAIAVVAIGIALALINRVEFDRRERS